MSKFYVTEFAGGGNTMPVLFTGAWKENAKSPMDISGVAQSSAPFGEHTALIHFYADAPCSILVSTPDKVVTARNYKMGGGEGHFEVVPGQVISVISNS